METVFPEIEKRFSFMRLPMAGEQVDIPQTKQMVDAFLAAGIHYFDTAHGYLNGQRKRGIHEGFPASVGTGAGGGVAGAGHSAGSEPDPLHWLPVLHRGLPHGNSHSRSVRLSQRQAAYRKHGSR